ncbi:MAG: hypothetical protein WBC44_15015 [Planctomycetaceae bacterium]
MKFLSRAERFGLIAVAAFAFVGLGCDVDVKDPGTMPDVDVDATPGEAPNLDVHGPDVDVSPEEKTVTVPDVDVDVTPQEETVTVPDVNVDVPAENEN